jgi:hypothetical protein
MATSFDSATRTSNRERLDAQILRSLSERRVMRSHRLSGASAWDSLERQVQRAATLLWEVSPVPATDDVLAFCAYLARELEVTESFDIDFGAEFDRLQLLAPLALEAIDVLIATLEPIADGATRQLASVLKGIRSELDAASSVSTLAA